LATSQRPTSLCIFLEWLINKNIIHGRGLVTSAEISCGEVVWRPNPEYPNIDGAQLQLLYRHSNNEYRYSQVGIDEFARNSTRAWNINHAYTPNCKISKGKLITLRSLKAGEEVSYDYGMTEVNLPFEICCQCRSETCESSSRTRITLFLKS